MSRPSEAKARGMKALDAIEVIEALANGVDPTTGEILPETSPYNRPVIIRALFTSLRALERLENREKWGRSLPENAGKPWSEEEDQLLIAAFDNGALLEAIAAGHGRTEGAIASRLVRLGRISEPSEARQSDPMGRARQ